MALRWLVLLVAVAVAIDISQAIFSSFKQRREKHFKRYLDHVNEKRSEMKKRHFGDMPECPLWACYGFGWDYDYESYEYGSGSDRRSGSMESSEEVEYFINGTKEAKKCMQEELANGELCDCSVDDFYWSGIFAEDMTDDVDCWKCLGKLPSMWDPDALRFSCDAADKIDEAEACFNNVADQSCLSEAMGGIKMDPKLVFDGIRMETKGCPLHDIVANCTGLSSGPMIDPYTACLVGESKAAEVGVCLGGTIQAMVTCDDIADNVISQIVDACQQGEEMMCKPFGPAIGMKQACCENDAATAPVPVERKLAKLLKKLQKKGY